MSRRVPASVIDASHYDTQVAETHRERARPVPTPPVQEPPAAWEATPEPEPAPQPKASRPTKIVLETRPRQFKPGDQIDDQTVEVLIDQLFGGNETRKR